MCNFFSSPSLCTLLNISPCFLDNRCSSDVRKAVLFNIEISEETLPYIIERARDADAGIRKHIFKKSMEDIDFAVLSIEARETLLKCGLRDRDASVKKACVQMLCENWLKKSESNVLVVRATSNPSQQKEERKKTHGCVVLRSSQLMTRLDAVGNTDIVEEALKAIFEANPNLPFKFDGNSASSSQSRHEG